MSGTTVPIVMTAAGLSPTAPADLLAQLLAMVSSTNPGYTADLPGLLIEDISSTDVGALVMMDQMLVDLVNSLTPYGVNEFLAIQLGNVYGVPPIAPSNGSVYCVFASTAGTLIPVGFTVGDGTYQYTVQDGATVTSSGYTGLVYCLCTVPGTFAIPANTVVNILTSLPPGVSITVTNPQSGTPGGTAETPQDYQVRTLQAGLASAQGMTRFLKTAVAAVPGVQSRLISAQQQVGGGWKIIVGGGDPYAVAGAIFNSLFDISTLVGSVIGIAGVTVADPGVVTTTINHGYVTGQLVLIEDCLGMTELNGIHYTITVLTEKTFSLNSSTTGFTPYTSGGVCTPNNRNVVVNINDYPDVYAIPIVIPPEQTVTMDVTWNTTSDNFVSPDAVTQYAQPALVAYVNALPVAQPINLFELYTTFQTAIASLLPAQLLTRLLFSVNINGVGTSPESGTGIIAGDPESYFYMTASGVTITQG